MEVKSQLHAPATLPTGKNTSSYWVGPRAGLHGFGEEKIVCPYSHMNASPSDPYRVEVSGNEDFKYHGTTMWTVIFLHTDCNIFTVIMYCLVKASEHSWGQRQSSTV